MGLRFVRPFVPRLPIGDRTFKGNVGNGQEKKGDSFNILPQLYRYHDRCDQDAITGSVKLMGMLFNSTDSLV